LCFEKTKKFSENWQKLLKIGTPGTSKYITEQMQACAGKYNTKDATKKM
jgi:hypothetical protein